MKARVTNKGTKICEARKSCQKKTDGLSNLRKKVLVCLEIETAALLKIPTLENNQRK